MRNHVEVRKARQVLDRVLKPNSPLKLDPNTLQFLNNSLSVVDWALGKADGAFARNLAKLENALEALTPRNGGKEK